jgi:hypothetical protein
MGLLHCCFDHCAVSVEIGVDDLYNMHACSSAEEIRE